VDIAPGIPHTYYLEIRSAQLFTWYIDGQVAATGVPEAILNLSDGVIAWRAKSWYLPSTTKWDYIRYGTIPADGSGDYDSNGVVDTTDVYFFLDCLLGPDANGPGCRWADLNGDGQVNGDDIQPFAAALAN